MISPTVAEFEVKDKELYKKLINTRAAIQQNNQINRIIISGKPNDIIQIVGRSPESLPQELAFIKDMYFPKDYSPKINIKQNLDRGEVFDIIYGHLSFCSFDEELRVLGAKEMNEISFYCETCQLEFNIKSVIVEGKPKLQYTMGTIDHIIAQI